MSYIDVYNCCQGFQNALNLHHYQVPQADMKPAMLTSP